MAIEEEKKHLAIKYDITLQCPLCGLQNPMEYIMGVCESFTCKKCKQKSNVAMSFIAMVDNPPGVRTMMIKPDEKRRLNTNVGSVNVSNRGSGSG